MAIVLRLLAVAAIWLFSRQMRSHAPAVVARLDRLSWPGRAELVWRLAQDDRVPVLARGVVLLPALYLLSPIDLLPDFIPGVGRIDDAAIFSIASDLLVRFAPVDVIGEHLDAVTGQSRGARTNARSAGPAGGQNA